jgi:uncharacterized protein (TIGR00255 family)
MTGYADANIEAPWGTIHLNLRSLNHRYLEISFRLPEPLKKLEKNFREKTQDLLTRGKVDIAMKFKPGKDLPYDFKINETLATKLANATKTLQNLFGTSELNIMDALSWSDVLQVDDTNMEIVHKNALDLITTGLEKLIESRRIEGEKLKHFMLQQIEFIRQQIDHIQLRLPVIINKQRQNILAHFEELKLTVDPDRLEQEITWFAQKGDIAEEVQRLGSHLTEVESILKKGGVVGRRLDFFMQELNREANTICSKSNDSDLTQAALEIKVFVEQMREQVQNIE